MTRFTLHAAAVPGQADCHGAERWRAQRRAPKPPLSEVVAMRECIADDSLVQNIHRDENRQLPTVPLDSLGSSCYAGPRTSRRYGR